MGNWGDASLGEHFYAESIDEMRHADPLIERLLFLEGVFHRPPRIDAFGSGPSRLRAPLRATGV